VKIKSFKGISEENKLNFKAKVRHHEISMDEPKEAGGDDAAPTPMEYFLAAIPSCLIATAKLILAKRHLPLPEVEVEVEAQQSEKPPVVYEKITIKFKFKGMEKEAAEKLMSSAKKYCPVHAMVNIEEMEIIVETG